MNVVLWILQVLLALHTLSGAMWKLSNAEAQVPSLAALPHLVWLALVPIELACALALVLPAITSFRARMANAPSTAATVIAAEMLLFVGVSIASGRMVPAEVGYWLVVAVICSVIAGGRAKLAPLTSTAA